MKHGLKRLCGYVIALSTVVFTVTAFAADGTADYGFRKGKANHYGTGGEQTFVYSKSHHADTESLVESGIIDQETADRISDYMSEKHEEISSMYEDMADMSAEERHAAFAERKAARKDSLGELVEKGIITQEQSDSIKNYNENK